MHIDYFRASYQLLNERVDDTIMRRKTKRLLREIMLWQDAMRMVESTEKQKQEAAVCHAVMRQWLKGLGKDRGIAGLR